jgi:archaetidylinositol phosphate synthase
LVLSNFKKQFEVAVTRLVKPLENMGITPNILTILGFLVSLGAAYGYLTWEFNKERLLISGVLILISGFIDAVDGVLARSTGKVSSFGGFLDSVADRYSDAVAISGLILGGLCNPFIGLAALIGSLMVSYTRSRAEVERVKMAGIGLAERGERMIFLALCSLTAFWWLPALNWGTLVLAILTHFTVIQRGLYFKKEIEKD